VTIVSSTPNDGSHSYTVPSSYTAGSSYYIRVEDTACSSCYDESSYFSIVASNANEGEIIDVESGNVCTVSSQGIWNPYLSYSCSENIDLPGYLNGELEVFFELHFCGSDKYVLYIWKLDGISYDGKVEVNEGFHAITDLAGVASLGIELEYTSSTISLYAAVQLLGETIAKSLVMETDISGCHTGKIIIIVSSVCLGLIFVVIFLIIKRKKRRVIARDMKIEVQVVPTTKTN
jgi:hypothetical protein